MEATPREVLTSILTQLDSIGLDTGPPSHNSHDSILSTLTGSVLDQVRSCLMTLHFLFPHEFLPALDLLDRHLVLRLQHGGDEKNPLIQVFYVQSASAVIDSDTRRRTAGTRYRNALLPTKVYYEVRLDSWNCTCAAFAHSQLKMLLRCADNDSGNESIVDSCASHEASQMLFGGTLTNGDAIMPLCKHMLAAAMCTAAPNLFGHERMVRNVSREELAGWAAGFGEGLE